MSVCCPPYTQAFSNAAVLAVSYGDSMRTKYGNAPDVDVYMWEPSLDAFVINPYASINITADQMNFDFGGLGTGFIKIS